MKRFNHLDRFVRLMLGSILCCLLMTSTASANCRVIHLLDQIQISQERLIQSPNTPSFQSDIRMMRQYINLLDINMVLDAFDVYAFSREGLTARQYGNYVQDLLIQTSIDDVSTAQRHFRDPLVLQNIKAMGQHLDGLRCTAAEVAASELPTPEQEDFGQSFREGLWGKINWNIVFIGSSIILSVILFAKARTFWLTRDERALARKLLRYETTCEVDGEAFQCVMYDISRSGAQLSKPSDSAIKVRTQVSVLFEDTWIAGRVMWLNEERCGVQFLQQLT